MAITNTLLRPILVLIALPFNLITFGIASIFANLLTLIIANAICGTILLHGFWLMFLVAAVMMFTDDLIRFIRTNRYKKHAANVS
ncbi:MAG: phage holin family protein [Anaerofustis sp.]